MVGIIGVRGDGATVADPSDAMYWEDWYDYEPFDVGRYTVGMVNHGGKDPEAHRTWHRGERVGLLFGVVTNRARLGWSLQETFERVLDDPVSTLARLDGPFLLAAVDGGADRALLATDKLGSRPGYFTSDGTFCSELSGVLPSVTEPRLDRQAISDMLLLNGVWGERTLVDGVRSVRPGHVVEFDGGDVEVTRYWGFSYGRERGRAYVEGLADDYRDAVGAVADTIDGPVGLWLSGGLDSRMLAGVLQDDVDGFETYTYVRPQEFRKRVGREDVDLAPRVADFLGVSNTEVTLDPDRLAALLPRCVDAVDGLVPWTTLSNLAAVFELPVDDLSVVLEGSGQSELLGEDMWRYHLDSDHYDDPTEPLLQRHGRMDVDAVRDLLAEPIDPRRTLEEEVAASPETDFADVVLDTNNRNLFANMQFLSNALPRSQMGTRHPFAHSDLLDRIGRLHESERMRTVPLTGGAVPRGFTRIKIDLARELNGGLERIPYEHSNVAPDRPYLLHTLGFVMENTVNRLFASPTLGHWYRDGGRLRETIDGLLEDAADRPVWDGGAVEDLPRSVDAGEAGAMQAAAVVTTVELWAQRHLDGAGVRARRRRVPASD